MATGRGYHKKIKTNMKVLDVFEKLKNNYPKNSTGLKSDYASKRVANTRHLNRILIWLEEVDYAYQTDFKTIGLQPSQTKDALLFLKNKGLIKCMMNSHSINVYCLPYKEKLVNELLLLEIKRSALKRKLNKNKEVEIKNDTTKD